MTGPSPRPPQWLTALLALIRDEQRRELIAGDLEEGYAHRVETGSLRRARRWYASQVVRSIVRGAGRRGQARTVRSAGPVDGFIADVRIAMRGLGRRPGFTIAAVVTLGLGIGATAAISAAVYRLLIAPLPFEGGDRMGYVWSRAEQGGMGVTPRFAVAQAWVENASTLERVELFSPATFVLSGEGAPEPVSGGRISPTLAATLGVRPVLGRYFGAEHASAGGEKVAILDDGFWRRRYGADRGILGRRITLDGESHAIIGVMPSRLAAFYDIRGSRDVWLPFTADSTRERASVLVTLRSDVGLEAVENELNAIADRVPDANPMPGEWRYRVLMPEHFVGDATKRGLLVLFAAVIAVLMIACANVAGLMLARGVARHHEMAIRAALGAGRARVAQHLAVESLLIALLGGALGLLVAAWALDVVRALRPDALSILDAAVLDPRVLIFTLGIAVLTAALFGSAPAVAGARLNLMDAMRGAIGVSAGVPSARLRAIMVTAQVALSLNLLVGALLLIRTFADLQSRDLGFEPAGLLSSRLALPDTRYPTPETRRAFFQEVLNGLQRLPAVASAAITSGVPGQFGVAFGELQIEDEPGAVSAGRAFPSAIVDAAFFSTLRVPLVEGRPFGEEERDDVIIVNRSTALRYWAGESALGKRLRLGDAPWRTVIGVAGDVATSGPAGSLDAEQLYYPTTFAWGDQTLLVRVRVGDPLALVEPIRELVTQLDPELPVQDVHTVEALMAASIARQRFGMALLTAFAATALALAAVGLYGLMNYSVAQRRRELGVRIALGARPAAMRTMVLRHGLRLTLIGLAIGGVTAFWLVLLLDNLLHGVPPRDTTAFGTAVTVVILAALLASYLPAARASAVDPVEALRHE